MPLAFSRRPFRRPEYARPPLPPRPTQSEGGDAAETREAGIINFYRGQLLRAHEEVTEAWAMFDATPESRYDTSEVRAKRRALNNALNDYYAAAGGRSPHSIVHVLSAAEECDRRIAALDHELVAEVRRFELLAHDVSDALDNARESADRTAAVAHADDALIELEIYRDTTAAALDAHTLARLDHSQAVLRSIVERTQVVGADVGGGGVAEVQRPPSPPRDQLAEVPSAPEPRDFPPIPAPSKRHLLPTHPLADAPLPDDAASTPVLRASSTSAQTTTTSKTSSTRSTRTASSRTPVLRAPSLRRRLRSHPAPPESAARRTRTVLRMRSRSDRYKGPQRAHTMGDGTPKRRRPSAFLMFGKAKSDNVWERPAAEDRRQPASQQQDQENSNSRKPQKRDMSNSVRSFLGLMRTPRVNVDGAPATPQDDATPPQDDTPTPQADEEQVPNGDLAHVSRSASASSGSSTESGEELPRGMVMARTRTLRDAAEFERHRAATDGETCAEERKVQLAAGASFSATLYHTNNARAEAVSDAGVLLTCSKVVGDGRCLFRSVARGRAIARGEALPKAHAEKKAADKLRARAVAELRKHRGLLLRFYVIEDNFENYIERMALPRTYAGEPELLMLAKVLHMPIAVYLMLNGMYRRIQLYGKHYHGEPIRIRYTNDTHYDALIPTSYPHRSK